MRSVGSAFASAVFVATALFLTAAMPASAQWRTWLADDPDGNGQPVLMHGETQEGPFLQFWCRGFQRRVALISYDGRDDVPVASTGGLSIEIRSESSGIWSSDGEPYRHHPGWAGVSYSSIDHMRDLAEIVIGAKSEIVVDVIDNDTGVISTYRFSAKASTASGRDFVAKCFGGAETIVAQPAQPTYEAPAQDTPGQPDAQQDVADIDEQIRLLDEAIEQADGILEQADEGLAQADETLEQVDELLADTAPGRLPWKTGTEGNPPVFFAHGPAISGDAVLLFGCELGNGPLLISFNGKAGVSSPAAAVGETLLLFAQTDFDTYVLQTQVTQTEAGTVTVIGSGEVAEKVLNDLIVGSQTLKMTVSTPDGGQAAERDIGLVEAGVAATQVREQCLPSQ